jgi:hypothetical protein
LPNAGCWKVDQRGNEAAGIPAPVCTVTSDGIHIAGDRRMIVTTGDKASACRQNILKSPATDRNLQHPGIIGGKCAAFF